MYKEIINKLLIINNKYVKEILINALIKLLIKNLLIRKL